MNELERMRETLSKIAQLAQNGVEGSSPVEDSISPDTPGCSIKALPSRLLRKAASMAIQINPQNAPMMAPTGDHGLGVEDPLRIAIMTNKYWGNTPRRLAVKFMDSASGAQRAKILSHLNAWSTSGCISFVETSGTGDVRITFGSTGYWSYLGTDILSIPSNRPTMNLQDFDRETRDSEFYRVVRHEAGHT